MTKGQAAIRALFAVTRDSVGNLPSMPGVFPDYRRLSYAMPLMPRADDGQVGHDVVVEDPHGATAKRAAKLEAKGQQVDLKELLQMEPDSGTLQQTLEAMARRGEPLHRPDVVLQRVQPRRRRRHLVRD